MLKRLLLFGTGLILIVIGIRQFDTDVFYSNNEIISGSFEYLRQVPLRQGRTEYRIKIEQNPTEYFIASFLSKSFKLEEFSSEVDQHDYLTLYLDKADSYSIAQIKMDGNSYINEDKRNSERRLNGTLACLAAGAFIWSGMKIKTKPN